MKKLLRVLKYALVLAAGVIAGAVGMMKIKNKDLDRVSKKVNKFRSYYNVLNQWMMLKNNGVPLKQYFEDNGYQSLAIYGMGEIGNRLYEELKDTDIKVEYAIDQSAGSAFAALTVYGLEDELQPVDVIVVTAVFAFDEIEDELCGKTDIPVISLEEIVFGLK